MFTRVDAKDIHTLTEPMSRRVQKGVFFVRLCTWDSGISEGLWAYHEAARSRGVVIEGQIANPDERQLGYLTETLGTAFKPEAGFVAAMLEKWMPRMSGENRKAFAEALCRQLDELRSKGKTESILHNIYIKMMCWLYYRFERLMPFLGEDDPPRILYECPSITNHELILLRMLSAMGADILLLEPTGDAGYLKHDPSSQWSQKLHANAASIPAGFALKTFRKEMAAKAMQQPAPAQRPAAPAPAQPSGRLHLDIDQPKPAAPAPHLQTNAGAPKTEEKPSTGRLHITTPDVVTRVQRETAHLTGSQFQPTRSAQPAAKIDPAKYFQKPQRTPCTNAWMKESDFTQILTPMVNRGDDFNLYYNAFIRVKGAKDKTTYVSDLYRFYKQFRATGRNIVIVDGGLTQPDVEEAQSIRRRTYRTAEELIVDLAGNLPSNANVDLQKSMQHAFVHTMEKAAAQEPNLNRLVISAVYLLCWIRRYQGQLFSGFKGKEMPCFVLMGGCRSQHDRLYPLFLSQLPVDVLILAPDLNRTCTLSDDTLLEISGGDSLAVMPFPKDAGTLQMRTVASHAEEDLTSVLYGGTGLYRDHQFARAEAITLQMTYDEVFQLWDIEMKYRPNFSTDAQAVNMPVVYAKISGVEKGKTLLYWQKIKQLLTPGTVFIDHLPMHLTGERNPYQQLAVKAVRDGRIRREEIRNDRQYPFGLLREELQQNIFDKLQLMLDKRIIKGTFVNGTEYTVIATVLNMTKDMLRMLQSFDYTKKNPKIVCVSTGEQTASLEDTILFTFLHMIGFDIAMFVPTGYQTVERYLNDAYPVEFQAGDYMYDLTIPDFATLPPMKGKSIFESLFGRRN